MKNYTIQNNNSFCNKITEDHRMQVIDLIDHLRFAIFMREPIMWRAHDCEARAFCDQLITDGYVTESEAIELYENIIEDAKKGRH